MTYPTGDTKGTLDGFRRSELFGEGLWLQSAWEGEFTTFCACVGEQRRC